MYLELAYVYLFLGLTNFVINYSEKTKYNYILLLWFFIFKIIFNYKKCTISYWECIIRRVKKEKGYLYQLIDGITNLRNSVHFDILLIIALIVSTKWKLG
jgi:hypothetical protein